MGGGDISSGVGGIVYTSGERSVYELLDVATRRRNSARGLSSPIALPWPPAAASPPHGGGNDGERGEVCVCALCVCCVCVVSARFRRPVPLKPDAAPTSASTPDWGQCVWAGGAGGDERCCSTLLGSILGDAHVTIDRASGVLTRPRPCTPFTAVAPKTPFSHTHIHALSRSHFPSGSPLALLLRRVPSMSPQSTKHVPVPSMSPRRSTSLRSADAAAACMTHPYMPHHVACAGNPACFGAAAAGAKTWSQHTVTAHGHSTRSHPRESPRPADSGTA